MPAGPDPFHGIEPMLPSPKGRRGSDVFGEVAALQLPADETNGDDDPLSQLWVLLLSQSDRLDEARKAGDCVTPRRFEDMPDDLRHLTG